MKVALSIVIFVLYPSSFLFSQERVETSQFGLYADGGLNIHSANFQTLPGVPSCCPRYENGTGAGFGLGVFYDFFPTSPFSLQIRLGYSPLNATLKTDEYSTVLLNGNSTVGEFEHSVQATIGMFGLTPLVDYHILPRAALLAGPTVGWMTSNTFTEQETLIQPANNGTFESGLRVRNVYSGTTPGASKLYLGVTAGAQYVVALNSSNTLFALPEVFGTFGVTPLVSGMNWRASSISGGVSFEYRMFAPITPPPPPPPLPPKPKPPALSASLAVATLDSMNNQQPLNEVVIEDYIRTQYRPLLNYIFFDSGSAEIPGRYHSLTSAEAKKYDFKKFNDYETLPLYYEILNIIGSRMHEYPKAKLTIIGCSASATPSPEEHALARGRAEVVFNYLVDIWGIDSNRIRIESRGLPEKPSNPSDTDGQVENRRTELYSNVPQILEPIFTTDTAHVPKPPIVRFLPVTVSAAGVTHWAIARQAGAVPLSSFLGDGPPVSAIDWNLSKESNRDLATLDTIHASLDVTDRARQTAQSSEVSVPVRHFTLLDKHRMGSTDTIVSRYSLILFDFDRSSLGEENRRISDFVKARISAKSRVRILGYTDRMGSDEYNQKLSENRALATQQYIGVRNADVRGLGRSALLFDNNLPEGRFYSRTVTVVVTTPTVR